MRPLQEVLKGPRDAFMKFYTVRQDREKKMIVVMGLCAALFVDYWLLINPVIGTFSKTLPELQSKRAELDELKQDKINETELMRQWDELDARAAEQESRFVSPNEIPALLENLSKMAQGSGLKILSVTPGKQERTRAMEPYSRVSVHISALAGGHELGKFLSLLESNHVFFRVAGLKVSPNPPEAKRQKIDLEVQVYRKGSDAPA